jgi:hypothetical protein
MKRLLAFGCFAHDPQRVLAAVHRLADVITEPLANFLYGVAGKTAIRLELGVAAFAYAEGRIPVISHDTQFALWHEDSLAPNACANETAPVPAISARTHFQTGDSPILFSGSLPCRKNSRLAWLSLNWKLLLLGASR